MSSTRTASKRPQSPFIETESSAWSERLPIENRTRRTGLPSAQECHRARIERDPKFDGRFFFGVSSTGIYCRPVCPARTAKAPNVSYFESAAAASRAGYRPCLRCRPDHAPQVKESLPVAVGQALDLIDRGALDDGSVDTLAEDVGVDSRQLRRMFHRTVGASPVQVAITRRLLLARQLLESSEAKVIDVAFAAGFGSLRRFNEAFKASFGVAPQDHRREPVVGAADLVLRLGARQPFAGQGVFEFLRARAIPGVERVTIGTDGCCYQRTFQFSGTRGTLAVALEPGGESSSSGRGSGASEPSRGGAEWPSLRLEIRFADRQRRLPNLVGIVDQVKQLFDLGFDPAWLDALGEDDVLGPLLARNPGIRVPGCYDPFELAVRAVLGQQVTVAGATTLSGRLARRWGAALSEPTESSGVSIGVSSDETAPGFVRNGEPRILFPDPHPLMEAPLEEIGLPRARAATLRALARTVAQEPDLFDRDQDLDDFVERFCGIPGIGPWTAHYVAMRVLHARDAFPASDLVLRKVLARTDVLESGKGKQRAWTQRQVEEQAAVWRPYRAYAAMLLWGSGAGAESEAEVAPRTPNKPTMKGTNK